MSPVIVLDRDIPFAEEIFSGIGEIVAVSGHEIDSDTVSKADAVVVRSITRVDENLLSGSSVRFVGTATAGMDHLDTEFLSESGIEWASAPGANARSVVEYVLAAISVIASARGESVLGKTLGVVGCGQVGERLCRMAEALGMRVLRNDPPREEQEGEGGFVDLNTCIRSSDIMSVHTPLTRSGPYATHGLLSASVLEQAKPGSWFVQSSRGGVVDEKAVLAARSAGVLGALVLDVFENEPTPAMESIQAADLATGHIAGYSRDAKRRGALMIRDAIISHFGLAAIEASSEMSRSAASPRVSMPEATSDPHDPAWMDAVLRQVYDLRSDDVQFREQMAEASDQAGAFHRYRAHYPARYEWSRFNAHPRNAEEARVLSALGFSVANDA